MEDKKKECYLISLPWVSQWQKFIHCSTLGKLHVHDMCMHVRPLCSACTYTILHVPVHVPVLHVIMHLRPLHVHLYMHVHVHVCFDPVEWNPPVAMDNTPLLQYVGTEGKRTLTLAKGAPFRKVSQEVWHFFQRNYGGGPVIITSLEPIQKLKTTAL